MNLEISLNSIFERRRLNLRGSVIMGLLKLTKSETYKQLEFIKSIEYKSKEEIKIIQREKLKSMLLHAYRNVPYYNRVLTESDVVADEMVNLDNFSKIPILTKDIIRKYFEELKSKDLNKRGWHFNTSGGSTGVPIKVIQDKRYLNILKAIKIYISLVNGKNIGEREIFLTGSERDILKNSIGFEAKSYNWLVNRVFLNSFLMSEEKMKNYVEIWNELKPVNVYAYVDSIYEFAKYIDRNNIKVWSPQSIIVTAATLHKDVRIFVQNVFKTKVINEYGSRDAGVIAFECPNQDGLHIFEFFQYVEVLNDNLEPANPGEVGKIYVTNLDNYSMPLIRYEIGDMGRVSTKMCSCGRGFSILAEVTGRVTDHFVRKDGTIIHGHYFTTMFYFKNWVNKFQVIQIDYNFIQIYIVLRGKKVENDLKDIEEKIKIVMGESCKVEFIFVDEIKPSDSGKHLYTKSLLYKR